MIVQIRYLGTDYVGNEIIEATCYRDGQTFPPVMIATSNTGLKPLKKTVRKFAQEIGEKAKFS